MKTIEIKTDDWTMTLKLEGEGGIIESSLAQDIIGAPDELCAAVDTVEALTLAHACAGIDVSSAQYVAGLKTVVEKIFQQYE